MTGLTKGEIIQINRGPGVPKELEGKYFIVGNSEDGATDLSLPFDDPECRVPYMPKWATAKQKAESLAQYHRKYPWLTNPLLSPKNQLEEPRNRKERRAQGS